MHRISLLTGAAVTALCLFTAPARADNEAIVVTATRTPTPAQTLPTRIDVMGRADIEALGLGTLAEAVGPEAVQSGGAGQQTSVFLRGANSNHTLALFDGVRLNDASTPTGAYDLGEDTLGGLERVEVLRGPASSVYGADALGGAVNMIPRRGGATAFEPFLEAAAGSFGTRRALLGAAGAGGGFQYGVSVESFDTDGFDQTPSRFTLHTGEPDGASIQTATASVREQAGAIGVDGLLRVRRSRADYDTFSGGAGFDLRADDPDLSNDATQTLWRLGGDARAGAATVRLSGGQVRGDRAETDGGFETASARSHQSSADLSARFAWAQANLTAGVSFERDAIQTRPQFADPLSVSEDQGAAYLIGQAPLFSHVTATASVRADHYASFGAHTTFQLGAVADFEALRVFASYGTAFKAPSLSERFEQSFFNHGNPDLKPEDSRSWELGGDWRANRALTLGASYYQTRIDDLIEYDFGTLRNINLGRASIDGAEAYAQLAPAPWASVRLSYAWTNARDGDGEPLLRRPENTLRLDARVRPTGRLALALTWAYVGERYDVTYTAGGAFDQPSARVASFNVGALSATYDLGASAQVFARLDNIADTAYEQPSAFAGAPRSLTMGLRTRF